MRCRVKEEKRERKERTKGKNKSGYFDIVIHVLSETHYSVVISVKSKLLEANNYEGTPMIKYSPAATSACSSFGIMIRSHSCSLFILPDSSTTRTISAASCMHMHEACMERNS